MNPFNISSPKSNPLSLRPTRWRRRVFAAVLVGLLVMASACGNADSGSGVEGLAATEVNPAAASASADSGPVGESPPVSADDGADTPAERQDAVASVDLPVGLDPARIEIVAIGVDAPVVSLDLRGSEPEVPTNFDDAGWYQQTRRPGEIGPAVIAGHIDSKAGPAVFARLNQLRPGDEITVYDSNGEHRTFVVSAEGQYSKDELPPEVFNFDKPTPELRLITCGGVFDRSSGHYRDNFVIYAVAKA